MLVPDISVATDPLQTQFLQLDFAFCVRAPPIGVLLTLVLLEGNKIS